MLTEQELELYNNDGKYRAYTNAIDKALKNFEYSSEWPDLISALAKLSKVISAHSTKFKSVPKTLIVSKRLAQCLHPSLPSGVHIKTLEVYDLVFQNLRGSPNNVFIYATGLFPLLQYAGITVRPMILKIFEDHFLSLGDDTVHILDGLLIGLLNGMEDGSDLNERCTKLLKSINSVVGDSKFYSKLWAAMSLSSTRLPAITYMIQNNFTPEDPVEIIEPLLSCLDDTDILVQRSALELINNWNMKTWKVTVRVEILAGAMGTLLRRDVSLNRRFFSMIKDETSVLIKATRKILSHHPEKFRIIMMLFDKPEVSGKILDAILVDIVRALYVQKENEVMQMFISNLESSYLVDYLSKLEMSPDLTDLIHFIFPYITGADFSPLVLNLIKPKDYMLQLAMALLAHCQNPSNQVLLKECEVIKEKLLNLYQEHIEADDIVFEPDAAYSGIQFKFDVQASVSEVDAESEIVANKSSKTDETSKLDKYQSKEIDDQSFDAGLGCDSLKSLSGMGNGESDSLCATIEPSSPTNGTSETEPVTNYFSLYDSLDCESVVSCNHHFGLAEDAVDFIKSDDLKNNGFLNCEKNGEVFVEKEFRNGAVRQRHDSEQSQDRINESIDVILNDLEEHLDRVTKNDGGPIEDSDDSKKDDSRPGSADTYVVETENEDAKSVNCTSLSSGDFSYESENFEVAREAIEEDSESAKLERLKAAMHRIIPHVITADISISDQLWLRSLLTACYSGTNSVAKQHALNSFLEVVPFIPIKKLRKNPVISKIMESLWADKNFETLARFLQYFPEAESLVVIKLHSVDEIINFQEFVLSCHNSCHLDSCVLKLIDNLEGTCNLIIHASFNCLNEIISKYPYIVMDPLIINMMDKSTKRHYYTDVKSNSTPDLRSGGSVGSSPVVTEKYELSPSSLFSVSKFIHRSTGNLSVCDSNFNVLVYNSIYDNRRVHFILHKLWRMLKFPEFVLKLCLVHLSESPRFKLLGKLVGQMHCFSNSNCNYINVVATCLINYITTFYDENVTTEDVLGNLEIQVTACSILNELCYDLIPLMNTNMGHQLNSFPCYIDSVMKDTKLSKKVLGGLLSILNLDDGVELSHCYRLLQFNYAHGFYLEIIQMEYIKLVTTLIQLESRVLVKDAANERVNEAAKKYLPNIPILDQPMFKSILVKGLQNCSTHWETLLRKSIGYCTNMRMVQHIIQLLCENLTSKNHSHDSTSINLSALTTILHFSILDVSHQDNVEMKSTTSESSWFNPFNWLPNLSISSTNSNNNISAKELGGIKHHTKFNLLEDFGMIMKTIVHVWIHYPSLKQKIINLLNPIALHHMEEFISSTSDIAATDDLVEIIVQLNVIRLTNLTNSTISVITAGKSPSNVINMLTLYAKYIERITTINYDLPNTLLISLIREGSNLGLPIGQNIVLVILNRIMCTIGLQSNWTKAEIKELQEVTQKLLEAISSNTSLSDSKKKGGPIIYQQDVIIASLNCLSENLHGLLDIVWGSDDKDKLLPILSHMIYLLMTHLKSKTSPSFTPTTILLTNLTRYTHLRKAWKKEIFEYLIDPSFFRMSLQDFAHWLVILDNIFSQDKNSFTELIARVTVPTSNSLNIFSSKETEYDNRASLLKRLCVVIYASETDEYVKFLNSIQERIHESLKASPIVIPNIQLSVMLLFRVLLKKLSCAHLTSLWPIIIHEIGICFSILEHHLVNSNGCTQYNLLKDGGAMERSWSLLFASVFKLLREANELPVFRMYSWNFLNNIIPNLKRLNLSLIVGFEGDMSSIEEDFLE